MADVLIYTRNFCGFCARAKQLLDDKGVDYKEVDAGYDPIERKKMRDAAGGANTFPQIFINGEHVGGCDQLMALERDGKLDPMLGDG